MKSLNQKSIVDEESTIPRVVLGDVPVTEFKNLVANHSDRISSLFGTPYLEWHRRPGSDLGDIVAVEVPSFYHEYVKEMVSKYITEGEHQAQVPENRRLLRIGQVLVGSEYRMGEANGGFMPHFTREEVSSLPNAAIYLQTLVLEVGAHQGFDEMVDKIQNLYRQMAVYPQLVLYVDVKPFLYGRRTELTAVPEQVPDLYLKAYLFTRENNFQEPIQILDVGDCDEHGQVHGRHPDQGAANLMIPSQSLYYGSVRPIPGDWLQVNLETLAHDLRQGMALWFRDTRLFVE